MNNLATIENGIELCKIIHTTSYRTGFYPALTGGLLYKEGSRKDIDIVLYRNRQKFDSFSVGDFKDELEELGVEVLNSHGFVTKCIWRGFGVDILNPEAVSGNYPE